jgi:hypothetical protein
VRAGPDGNLSVGMIDPATHVSEVNAQTGKKISTAQAASFITQAQNIEAALGC